MTPRMTFMVLLVLSALSCSYSQSTEGIENTTQEPNPTPAPTTPGVPDAPTTSDPTTDPAAGTWNVTQALRRCILTKMGVRFGFEYTDKNNQTQSVSYDLPAGVNDSVVTGSCGDSSTADENISIAFFENDGWKFGLTFKYDNAKKEWSVTDVSVEFVFGAPRFDVVNTTTYTMVLANETLYQTTNSSSYQCVSKETLTGFVGDKSAPTLNVTTTELHIEAFRTAGPGDFSTSIPCPADTAVSNIVPIAVGAALAALVVIVLIAYLIGRKKSRRGYESV